LQTARDRGAFTVALTGESGGRMASVAHVSVQVPSHDTARIQEAHILCGHILCEWLEAVVTGASCLTALGSAK
jgi:D-sedoheptulose 7-phosphate isomerase